jgi:hypothetical protein
MLCSNVSIHATLRGPRIQPSGVRCGVARSSLAGVVDFGRLSSSCHRERERAQHDHAAAHYRRQLPGLEARVLRLGGGLWRWWHVDGARATSVAAAALAHVVEAEPARPPHDAP